MNMKATIRKGCPYWARCRREPRRKGTITIKGEFVICHGPAWLSWFRVPIASVQIYSNTLDSGTGFGRISERAFIRRGKTKTENNQKKTTYKLKFEVAPEFGTPGAFLIKNRWCHEFFLESATLHYSFPVEKRFDCRSWVYPFKKTKTPRVFFSNTSYLPGQTPEGLKKLREYELKCLRGELAEEPQPHERRKWDRIYEYAEYNDLGDPERGPEYSRPVLGGKRHPYPRRLKTNRRPCKQDSSTESRPITNDIGAYIPPDERLSPEKVTELKTNLIKAIVYFLLPVKESHLRPPFSFMDVIRFKWYKAMIQWFKKMIKSIEKEGFLWWKKNSGFNQNLSLNDMFEIFSDKRRQPVRGWIKDKLKRWVPNDELYKQIVCEQRKCKQKLVMDLPLPSIIAVKKWAWRTDEEFGRQMVAGTNPVRIRRLQNLQVLPKDSKILKKKYKLKIEERLSYIYRDFEEWILEELTKTLELKKQQKETLQEFDKDDKKILEELTKYWEKKKKRFYDGDGGDKWIFEELTKYLEIKKTQEITIGDENKYLKIKKSKEITIEELSFLDIEELPPNSEIETPTDKLEIEEDLNDDDDDVDERILGMVTKYLEAKKKGKITLEQIAELGHIFILDHQDHLHKYLSEVNRNTVGGARAYASLTLLFRDFKNFKFIPVAIELSLSSQNHMLIVAPSDEYMEQETSNYFTEWDLAKTHVAANDSAHHLLVSHWLHTHAVVEPFIIATRRRLSKMHPIHCLLDPHFKDTIHINALGRAFIINAGGILEKTLFTGKFSMELSSEFYKEWRFNRQALPCDLVKRGMVRNVPKSSEQPQREALHCNLVKGEMIEIVPISNEQYQREALHGDPVKRGMVENVPILNEQSQREALHGDPVTRTFLDMIKFFSDMVENVPISDEQPQREALHSDPVKSDMVENIPISDETPQREALHGDPVKCHRIENVPISNEQPQREALHGDTDKRDKTKPSEDPGPEVDCNYYPYASDGLKIWNAIQRWVKGFCEIFYESDDCVQKDEEIQQWWKEIQEKGHPDARKGWDKLTNRENLIKALTTIIWIASALHAAVNFGQYAYALTRPMMCHEYLPGGGTEEFDESFFVHMLPNREEMEIGMALMSFLSYHTSDEVYLGQRQSSFWSDNEDVVEQFRIFTEELERIQDDILRKNKSYKLANHRSGAAKIPYKLLYPDISSTGSRSGNSRGGITAKGIPNSISI